MSLTRTPSWFDYDSLILNPNISWDIFLPPEDFSHINLIASKDWNGLNAGIFFVRVNSQSVDLFTEVLALPKFKPELDLGFSADQSAIAWVLAKDTYRETTIYQPIEWHNRFSDGQSRLGPVEPGDLLVHFADVSRGREEPMKYWLERIEKEPETFEVPLTESTYPSRIAAFWDRLRDARNLIQAARDFLDTSSDAMDSALQILILQEATAALEDAVRDWAFKATDMVQCQEALSEALEAAGGARRVELAR